MFRRAAVLAALVAAGCGEPEVQRPAQPIWCPAPVVREGASPTEPGEFDARRLLGLDEERARGLARREGCELRVVERDGESLPVTMDLRADRINVEVEDGTVVRIDRIG